MHSLTYMRLIYAKLSQSTFYFIKNYRWTFIFHKPDLNSRVHVIVDVIVFQHTVTIVIEVDTNLFKLQM